jgi:hypothetical protein
MASPASRSYPITLVDFTLAFVPFAILLGAALLAAEQTPDPGFYRTVYTIWATAALVTPALCAFVLPSDSPHRRATWILFWTFAFLVYIVHLYYAVFWVYHGSFNEFMAGQGWFAAVNNVLFTGWWLLDILLAWFYRHDVRWVRIERVLAHWYIGLTFFASTLILKHGFINVIGAVMAASVVVCLLIRFDAGRRFGSTTVSAP